MGDTGSPLQENAWNIKMRKEMLMIALFMFGIPLLVKGNYYSKFIIIPILQGKPGLHVAYHARSCAANTGMGFVFMKALPPDLL
jgi:hypothetical protein